jgi:hypothetical protein
MKSYRIQLQKIERQTAFIALKGNFSLGGGEKAPNPGTKLPQIALTSW